MSSLSPPGAYVVEKGLCQEAVGNSSQDDGSTCKLRRSCTKRYQCFLVSSLRTGFIRPRMRDISSDAVYSISVFHEFRLYFSR